MAKLVQQSGCDISLLMQKHIIPLKITCYKGKVFFTASALGSGIGTAVPSSILLNQLFNYRRIVFIEGDISVLKAFVQQI